MKLLLAHGWGANHHSWDPITALLAPQAEVLAPDLPGHGERAEESGLTIDRLVGDLAGQLDEPVVAIGHSMGGQVVARLAVQHPSLVQALVVIDPAYGADDAEMAGAPAVLADLRTRGTAAGVDFVDRAFAGLENSPLHQQARAQMARTPGAVLADLYESMYLAHGSIGARPATRAFLPTIHQPCLSLYSTEHAATFARSIPWPPGSTITVWPGTTHYLHQQHPHLFIDLLKTWLSTH
ncbi:pimeloyl-ACP methyl ester carboxylesterase [Kribbella antiqua]|uniref:Pimeloyl-ACP methyl ester carboxylesterase n=1 Tax=Kribbella antiqua TaxID=2512217 RepID=A0A4R2IY60_9ACTN|nr:alpha/beta hydrolase [Kribbella antiqua]TCO49952.1 pimeloyl-ACP methyl ester carboxylesterase [Kribbella antiqua]